MISGAGISTSDYARFPWKNVRRSVYPMNPEADSGPLPCLQPPLMGGKTQTASPSLKALASRSSGPMAVSLTMVM